MADVWRAHEDVFVRNWEGRFGRDEGYSRIPREAAAAVLKKCNLTTADIAKVCLYGSDARAHADLVKRMGFAPEQIQHVH